MKHVERLRQAIRDLHGLNGEHIESVPITETFQGKTVWQGIVDVFRVRGHPQATHAYAWSYKTENGTIKHVAVLGVPPINSAQDAVKAAVMAYIEKQRS
jgi:hypothetical protein